MLGVKTARLCLSPRRGEDIKFDLQGQRCIIYKNIVDLAKSLDKDLTALRDQSS
jgi:hypothetical protein